MCRYNLSFLFLFKLKTYLNGTYKELEGGADSVAKL